jgi:hypothetical protein
MGTCTIECWGCQKSETHPFLHGKKRDALMVDLAARGWRRRAFWSPNWDRGPWFCSEVCANNSQNAKQAQKYWEEEAQKEFEKYCEKTKFNRLLFKFGVLALLIGISLLGVKLC